MSIEDTAEGLDKGDSPNFVTALARGLKVIEAFTSEYPEMTLTEIAKRTGISPASVRRSLFTLEALGFVALNGRRYVLRAKVLTLGAAYFESMQFKDIAMPPLGALARQFQDTVSLAVLDETNVIYVVHIPSERRIRFRASVGYRLPIYATSLGRAIMAYQSPSVIETYLELSPFTKYTGATVTDPGELRAIFQRARELGYATQEAQLEFGVVAVAVPVMGPDGKVIAALNCSSETARGSLDELVETRLPALREAAQEIEGALRRQPFLAHSI
jgi:IclR family pca regulon transcriptional regulator